MSALTAEEVVSSVWSWFFWFVFVFLHIPFHKGFGSAVEWKSEFFSVCFAKWEKNYLSLNIRRIHKITAFYHGLFFFFLKSALDSKIEFDEGVVVCVLFKNVENT